MIVQMFMTLQLRKNKKEKNQENNYIFLIFSAFWGIIWKEFKIEIKGENNEST